MKKKVFLADDSITIQKVVELTFSASDYEVSCAGDGRRALEGITGDHPDIALLDVVMPEIDGYEVCSRLKKNADTSWLPVILLTGAFEPFDEKRAEKAGAAGHLKKPFESRALISRVEELIRAHPRPGTSVPEPEPKSEARTVPEAKPEREPAAPPAAAAVAKPERVAPAPPAPPVAKVEKAAQRPAAEPRVSPEMVEAAVREAVSSIADRIVREVAWEVIPDLAEAIIKRRIKELEQDVEKQG